MNNINQLDKLLFVKNTLYLNKISAFSGIAIVNSSQVKIKSKSDYEYQQRIS
jgi:hypothetical protein